MHSNLPHVAADHVAIFRKVQDKEGIHWQYVKKYNIKNTVVSEPVQNYKMTIVEE
jgi:hypothetical protein